MMSINTGGAGLVHDARSADRPGDVMFKNAVQIFEIFGFKLKVDPSWLLIAALIVWSLSTSYFPPGSSRPLGLVLHRARHCRDAGHVRFADPA
jgi:hypothetical protein